MARMGRGMGGKREERKEKNEKGKLKGMGGKV
jgi:hypothetical protein